MTVITEESLDWVTFSDDEAGDCEATRTDCPLEAVVRAVFVAYCKCCPNPQRLCAEHGDRTAANAQVKDGWFSCSRCGGPIFLLRIEPIR